MPASIVLVHSDLELIEHASSALRLAGYTVAAFTDPIAALDALEAARQVQLLITRIAFPPGTVNGVALARMARLKRPDVRVLFVAQPETEEHAAGLGEFLPMPASVADVVAAARRVLSALGQAPS